MWRRFESFKRNLSRHTRTAHALAVGCTLITNNEREFRRVKGLVVENWLV